MKVIFLCGCLEMGRDGVGDYTRRLAGELTRQGTFAAIISLNDYFITEEKEYNGVQNDGDVDLPVLRLPSAWSYKKRFRHAEKYINTYNPEWLSLQYVPFSFHSKGLPLKFHKRLTALGNGKNWHIMFHELWVGMDTSSSPKMVLLGYLQKRLIQNLLDKLQPAIINTQTKLYQIKLHKMGCNAEILPLFSNIPVVNHYKSDKNLNSTTSGINKIISFVLFGGIHHGAPIDQFAEEAYYYAKENEVIFNLRLLGRSGAEQDNWVSTWKSFGHDVEIFGEQTANRISEIFLESSFGIATTPLALTEKSGAIAAMQAHGLGVILVARSWQPRGFSNMENPKGIIEYRAGNFKDCIINRNINIKNNISDISRQLVSTLGNS
ncbi:glycosyltransferase [Adhaeribacter aquaticus]|uniref:glycosyltransferase n=1 Tax=Adhaeribacter aquaticus TaxID=299567 RepID=UPI00042A234F|nr:glycosyltransferase [Adhaeribacter aquaticus]